MRVGSNHFQVFRRLLSSRAWIAAAVAPALLASCARGDSPALVDDGDAPAAIAVSEPSPICARYLSCVARGPDSAERFGAIATTYGPGAACWAGDGRLEAECSEACREGALAMTSCGECDEDDACDDGLACIGRRCRSSGCRVDARRAEALIADACRCSDDCEGDAAFVQLLAASSAGSDCAAPFDAWVGCELEHGACPAGIANFYGQCAPELDRLTACENAGASLRCR